MRTTIPAAQMTATALLAMMVIGLLDHGAGIEIVRPGCRSSRVCMPLISSASLRLDTELAYRRSPPST